MKSIRIIVIALNLIVAHTGFSQDIHFSQFDLAPLNLNPALTGTFGGTHRVVLNYKDQWKAFGAPYKTFALSYDFLLLKEKWDKAKLGGGLFVFRDQAGALNLSSTQVQLSLASTIALSDNHKLSAGLQGGFVQNAVNLTDARTDNQFVGGGFNGNLATGETNSFEPRSYGDFTGGLSWQFTKNITEAFADDQFKARVGIALYHINRPLQEFTDLINDRLYAKMSVHGDAFIGLKGTPLALMPSFLFLNQGPSQELNIGTLLRYKIKEGGLAKSMEQEMAVSLGGYFRIGDAFIPEFVLEITHFKLGVSYDVNTSDLNLATNGQGGLEISLTFVNPSPLIRAKSRTLF